MQFETIQTPRLVLRALTPEVYEYVFTKYTQPEIMDFFGCATDKEYEEELKKYRDGLSMYRKSLLIFQLIEKESNKVIGWCGYHTWYIHHHRAEIGYMLTDDAKKNRGYMKEALPAVLQYGFEKMALHRVEAMAGKDNTPSLKLLESHGFIKEGFLREHYFVNGRYEDSLVFSLIRFDRVE